MKILSFFLFYGSFLPSWILIRNLYADPDPAAQINADPCGSGYGSETLVTRYRNGTDTSAWLHQWEGTGCGSGMEKNLDPGSRTREEHSGTYLWELSISFSKCRSGSGILSTLDPGYGKEKNLDPGSGMNYPELILVFLCGSGSGILDIVNPRSGIRGITRIPDPGQISRIRNTACFKFFMRVGTVSLRRRDFLYCPLRVKFLFG